MLIHDILKIKYVKMGFIQKNYPYHLISDEEMFNAFIDLGTGFTSSLIDPNIHFFDIYYPNPFADKDAAGRIIPPKDQSLMPYYLAYGKLVTDIKERINAYLAHYGEADTADYEVPDWVYTYMLGEVVYQQSEYLDIQDTLDLLGCSNLDNIFTREACIKCYTISSNYVSTLTSGVRRPTVFGEPHVIKRLRMEN